MMTGWQKPTVSPFMKGDFPTGEGINNSTNVLNCQGILSKTVTSRGVVRSGGKIILKYGVDEDNH
jgi:hypothetical protein